METKLQTLKTPNMHSRNLENCKTPHKQQQNLAGEWG